MSQTPGTCHFFRCLFNLLPVQISTSDLHHRSLQRKIYQIRSYDLRAVFLLGMLRPKPVSQKRPKMFCAVFTRYSPIFFSRFFHKFKMGVVGRFLEICALEKGEKMTMYGQNSTFLVACVNDNIFWAQSGFQVIFHIVCGNFGPELVKKKVIAVQLISFRATLKENCTSKIISSDMIEFFLLNPMVKVRGRNSNGKTVKQTAKNWHVRAFVTSWCHTGATSQSWQGHATESRYS